MGTTFLLRNTFRQVTTLLAGLPQTMYFHNIRHTEDVFLVSSEMGIRSGLSANELLVLQVAALFHDTGYCYNYHGHEEKSKLIAANFLLQENCAGAFIDTVLATIEATKVPQTPQDELQRIICDADLFHLSEPDYPLYNNWLRQEWEAHDQKTFSDAEWQDQNISFLKKHHYFTAYGQDLESLKQHNLQKLQRPEVS